MECKTGKNGKTCKMNRMVSVFAFYSYTVYGLAFCTVLHVSGSYFFLPGNRRQDLSIPVNQQLFYKLLLGNISLTGCI